MIDCCKGVGGPPQECQTCFEFRRTQEEQMASGARAPCVSFILRGPDDFSRDRECRIPLSQGNRQRDSLRSVATANEETPHPCSILDVEPCLYPSMIIFSFLFFISESSLIFLSVLPSQRVLCSSISTPAIHIHFYTPTTPARTQISNATQDNPSTLSTPKNRSNPTPQTHPTPPPPHRPSNNPHNKKTPTTQPQQCPPTHPPPTPPPPSQTTPQATTPATSPASTPHPPSHPSRTRPCNKHSNTRSKPRMPRALATDIWRYALLVCMRLLRRRLVLLRDFGGCEWGRGKVGGRDG